MYSSAAVGSSSAGVGSSSAGVGDSSAGMGDSSAGVGNSSAGVKVLHKRSISSPISHKVFAFAEYMPKSGFSRMLRICLA